MLLAVRLIKVDWCVSICKLQTCNLLSRQKQPTAVGPLVSSKFVLNCNETTVKGKVRLCGPTVGCEWLCFFRKYYSARPLPENCPMSERRAAAPRRTKSRHSLLSLKKRNNDHSHSSLALAYRRLSYVGRKVSLHWYESEKLQVERRRWVPCDYSRSPTSHQHDQAHFVLTPTSR